MSQAPPNLEFTIPGKPQPWQRAGRAANGKFYTPGPTRRFEARDGHGWTPSPLLARMAERGETFGAARDGA